MATAIAAVAGFIAAYGSTIYAVIQVAIAAYAVYSTFSAYSAQKKQEKAAKKSAMQAQERNAYRNYLNPLAARRVMYGHSRVAGPFVMMHNPEKKKKIAWMIVAIASHEIEAFTDFWLLHERLPVRQEPGDWGELVSTGYEESTIAAYRVDLWSDYNSFGLVTGQFGKQVILWPFRGTDDQDIGLHCRTATDPRRKYIERFGMDESGTELSFYVGGFARNEIGITLLGENDKLRGVACMVIRINEFSKTFPQQSPDFAATVKGKRVFDPRDGVTRYTANAALCAADYLTSYAGFAWEAINTEKLIEAANICDELVPLKGGGYERRYESNGAVVADQTHESVLEMFADAMAGKIRYVSGQWLIDPGAPREVTAELDESQVLEEYEVSIEKPTRSLPNAVRGTFWDQTSWQASSFPAYQDEAAIAADGGVISWMDVELPLTTSQHAAQRIARIMLRRARSRMTFGISLDLRGMKIKAGDVVRYSAPEIGIENLICEVEGWKLGISNSSKALTVSLELSDYDPETFAWNAETDTLPMARGEAAVNSAGGDFISELTYTEEVTSTETNFTANYVVNIVGPPEEDAELARVTATVEVIIYFDDGTKSKVSDEAAITSGFETINLSVEKSLGAKIYASHDVVVTAKGKLTSGVTGPEQEAEPA